MARSDTNDLIPDKSSATALTILLVRLDDTLYGKTSSRRLSRSPLECTRVGANIEYARNLLSRLEQSVKPSSQQAAKGTDLLEKRAHLKKLQDRLYELSQGGDAEENDASSSESDQEDLLNRYAPAKDASNGIKTERFDGQDMATTQIETTAAATNPSSELRARRTGPGSADDTATTTGTFSTRPAGPALTSPFAPPSSKTISPRISDGETLLAHHTAEQESLTDSLLQLATALKKSTQSFSETLESSNPIVDQAAAALDKSVGGMEAAGRRMGMLRRLTEGKGWWARLTLYGQIFVLWVMLVLIMFVMPKLRF